MAIGVRVVPHTHWDREWYSGFQTFRLRLVDTIDQLLSLMESDPTYTHFLLDGQVAAVDDYLAVRPQNRARLVELARSGRLAMGPWYTLMDEFLVSPETIVRDLQLGMARAEPFGGAMQVGYLPDMFGHIAQMPQLLVLAGFEHAVVWRGVPSQITATCFWWTSPDGSTVRTQYLPVGYGNGARIPEDPAALIARVSDHLEEIGEMRVGDLLYMNGSDHLGPDRHLGPVLEAANAAQDELSFSITSLADYLASAPPASQQWHGELRSGARANILMGVTSNRVDVRHAQARAERALEHRAEPFSALFMSASNWPSTLLEEAWHNVISDAAHDSVCACSVDEVVDQVLVRYAEAAQIGEGVARRAIDALATSLAAPGRYVVNPSQFSRSELVELLTDDEIPSDGQLLAERALLPSELRVDSMTVASVLSLIEGNKLGDDGFVSDAVVNVVDDHLIEVELDVSPIDPPGALERVGRARNDLYAAIGARPDAEVVVTLRQPLIRRVLIRTSEVPGYGWVALSAAPATHRVTVCVTELDVGTPGAVSLDNDLCRVVIDPSDGTFSLTGLPGFGRIEDCGDFGDSYNYSPPVADTVIDAPESIGIEVIERGPLRASVKITAVYVLPSHIDPSSSARVGSATIVIETTVSLEADSKHVRVTTSFINTVSDHRLRMVFALAERASHSVSESAYCEVARGLSAEGRPGELGLATFPSRRFVRAGGLTIAHIGVAEFELIDIDEHGAGSIALTLVRATGMLSRLGMRNRPLPAGPLVDVEGLKMLGRRVTWEYALSLHDVDPYRLAAGLTDRFELISASGGGWREATGQALHVTGAQVSTLRRVGDLMELRVWNPSDDPSELVVTGRHGDLVDLCGKRIGAFAERMLLGPHQIATLHLA